MTRRSVRGRANETRPQPLARALNPDPEKPATRTSPGSCAGHERERSSSPSPTDHESPITSVDARSSASAAARSRASTRCCWHRTSSASARSAIRRGQDGGEQEEGGADDDHASYVHPMDHMDIVRPRELCRTP